MNIALLALGTELTRGEALNGNGRVMAEELSAIGRDVHEILCVDDDTARIVEALRRLGEQYDFVIATGGLGPTTDDLTREAVARLLGTEVVTDPESLRKLEERLRARGRELTVTNSKMAQLPAAAKVVMNPAGSAIGFEVKIGRARCWFLPGVPAEALAMFRQSIVPVLLATGGPCTRQRILRTVDIAESAAGERLAGLEEKLGITLGYRVHAAELEVKVLATGAEPSAVEATVARGVAAVRERLGRHVFSEGATTLAQVVAELLHRQRRTLALAESCTGGVAAAELTAIPGISEVFLGSVVAYHNAVKEALLGVPPLELETFGAVSEPVAKSMAEGARRRLGAEVALSFTGIAGPEGGTPDKPVGLVHYALATPGETLARSQVFFGARPEVQRRAVAAGLELLRGWLLEREGGSA